MALESIVSWLKEGDGNTKLFHKMANTRRNVNDIHYLWIGGVRESNEEVIKMHAEEYFLNQYSKDRPIRPKVDGLSLPCLQEGQAEWLERPFDEEEVKKAVWILDGDKAPGAGWFLPCFL